MGTATILKTNTNTPTLTEIYLYLMDTCNLACSHCWIAPNFDRRERREGKISLEQLKDIFDQAKELGLLKVKLTGGEPLLYKDFIPLVRFLKEKKLALHMETNGTLVTDEIADAIKEANFFHCSVSIDGATSNSHEKLRGVKGSFDKAIEGAKKIIERKISLQIIAAVYKGNRDELEDIVKLSADIGASSIKLNYINTMGRGQAMADRGELLSIKEIIELDKYLEEYIPKKYNIKFVTSLPMAFRSLEYFRRNNISTCQIKHLLGVLADGKISICGIGEQIEELILGDSSITRLKDIWENNQILVRIRQDIPDNLDGICSRCMMRKYCLGHCVADSYYRKGSLMQSFWICEEAYKEGLFPKTRLA